MREIKFRVYDSIEKKYIQTNGYHIYVNIDGSLIANPTIDGKKYHSGLRSKFIIEQSTGLYDKNGKEIYEGDNIILHQFLFDGGEYENQLIGQVIYDDNQACYCLTNIKNEQVQEYMGYKDDYTNFQKETVPINLFYGMHEESFEVIGNIHDKE